MKLFAGIDDGLYEYAIWAVDKKAALSNVSLAHVLGELTDQSGNKALEALCPKGNAVYRRDLGHEENEWGAVNSNSRRA